jgi:hypothetical protein
MYVLPSRRGVTSLVVGFGLAIFGVILAILIGTIVNTMRDPKPLHPTKPPKSAIVWGDRVFVGPGSLAHWLKVRGIGYSVWADRHPPANNLLQRQKALRERAKK